MRLEVKGVQYCVKFYHSSEQGRSACEVLVGTEDPKPEFGEAWCSPSDHFNKRVGRKISFGRAISDFDRETREEFWKAYFEKMPQDMRAR